MRGYTLCLVKKNLAGIRYNLKNADACRVMLPKWVKKAGTCAGGQRNA